MARPSQSVAFETLMNVLWGAEPDDVPFSINATAANLRGRQRFNYENACEVLRLVHPGAKVIPALEEAGLGFHVEFEDGSKGLIVADFYGCGNGYEWIS